MILLKGDGHKNSTCSARSFLDSYTIWDNSTQIPAVSTLSSLLSTANSQLLVQQPAMSFFSPDILIDTLMADRRAMPVWIELHTFSYLFGQMLLLQLRFDVADRLRRYFNSLASIGSSRFCFLLRLFRSISPQSCLSSQFPADGAWMHRQFYGNVILLTSSLLHRVNLDTIVLGQLSIFSHKCSFR